MITPERLAEIEASPREAGIFKAEAKELVDAYRERVQFHCLAQEAADTIESQAAEIAKLTAFNSALTDKCNSYIIDNTRLAEERDARNKGISK